MVNLIVAQRAYEMNSKAITTSDEMLQQANNLKARLIFLPFVSKTGSPSVVVSMIPPVGDIAHVKSPFLV